MLEPCSNTTPNSCHPVTVDPASFERVAIPLTDGQRESIRKAAILWIGTPYGYPTQSKECPAYGRPFGINSKRGTREDPTSGADCNGTIWGVYREAGIPYTDFSTHRDIMKKPNWRETKNPKMGDVVRWDGHLAIYKSPGVIWTAHNMNSTEGFSEMPQKYMRPGKEFQYYEFITFRDEK
jgi:cell wall-associated NlpC family hydrolase